MAQGNQTESGDAADLSSDSSQPVDPASRRLSPHVATIALLVAVAAAGIVTARFSPRFVLWCVPDIAGDLPAPPAEVDRAVFSLTQLDDPWAPVNSLITW